MYKIVIQGTEGSFKEIKGFNTKEEAETKLKECVLQFCRKVNPEFKDEDLTYEFSIWNVESDAVSDEEGNFDTDFAEYRAPEVFQSWDVREDLDPKDMSPLNLVKLLKEHLNDADTGISIYAADLQDIQVAKEPVCGAMDVLDRLSAFVEETVRKKETVIAEKIWTKDDIRAALEREGYKTTDENVSLVACALDTAWLEDCTDQEWETFFIAIRACEDELEKEDLAETFSLDRYKIYPWTDAESDQRGVFLVEDNDGDIVSTVYFGHQEDGWWNWWFFLDREDMEILESKGLNGLEKYDTAGVSEAFFSSFAEAFEKCFGFECPEDTKEKLLDLIRKA